MKSLGLNFYSFELFWPIITVFPSVSRAPLGQNPSRCLLKIPTRRTCPSPIILEYIREGPLNVHCNKAPGNSYEHVAASVLFTPQLQDSYQRCWRPLAPAISIMLFVIWVFELITGYRIIKRAPKSWGVSSLFKPQLLLLIPAPITAGLELDS